MQGEGDGGLDPHFPSLPPLPREGHFVYSASQSKQKISPQVLLSHNIINVHSDLCKTIHASFSFAVFLTRNTVYRCMISTITLNKAYFLHLLLIINKQFLFF